MSEKTDSQNSLIPKESKNTEEKKESQIKEITTEFITNAQNMRTNLQMVQDQIYLLEIQCQQFHQKITRK